MKLTITRNDVPTILSAFNLPRETEVVFVVDQPKHLGANASIIRSMLQSMGGKLEAIKVVREVFEIGLKEAKDLIDGIWEK